MQTRRHWLILVGTAVLALTLGTPALAVTEANLSERLRAGLKVRTKAEHKFIDRSCNGLELEVLEYPSEVSSTLEVEVPAQVIAPVAEKEREEQTVFQHLLFTAPLPLQKFPSKVSPC